MDSKLSESQRFSAEQVLQSEVYKLRTSCLKDPRLENNIFYGKLVSRLQMFIVQAEKYRLVGTTEKQQEVLDRSGFSFQYRMQLHSCLKKLILEVISTRDARVQLVYLKEVFAWFFAKLTAMGALSRQEYEEEFKLLNPLTNKMADAMRLILEQKVRSSLINEEDLRQHYKALFEEPEYGYHEA